MRAVSVDDAGRKLCVQYSTKIASSAEVVNESLRAHYSLQGIESRIENAVHGTSNSPCSLVQESGVF